MWQCPPPSPVKHEGWSASKQLEQDRLKKAEQEKKRQLKHQERLKRWEKAESDKQICELEGGKVRKLTANIWDCMRNGRVDGLLTREIHRYWVNRVKQERAHEFAEIERIEKQNHQLSEQERQALVHKKTGLMVFNQNTVSGWEQAREFCLAKGMDLPDSKSLKQHSKYLLGLYKNPLFSEYSFSAFVSDKPPDTKREKPAEAVWYKQCAGLHRASA